MGILEGFAKKNGWDDAINNPMWQSFKSKSPTEVIPHATQVLKENGQLGKVMSFFGGKNEQPPNQ